MQTQTPDALLPVWDAEDLVAMEARRRLLAAADIAVSAYQPGTDAPIPLTPRDVCAGFDATAARVLRDLAAAIGEGPKLAITRADTGRIVDELSARLWLGIVDREHQLFEDLHAEEARVQAERDAIDAEIKQMMIEGKPTKRRTETMVRLSFASSECWQRLSELDERIRRVGDRFMAWKKARDLERRDA